MPNLTGLRAAASRFSIESWLFALPMTAPANRCSIAFAHFLTIHVSDLALAAVAPPKGGIRAVDKPMTLLSHEHRDKLSGARRRVLLFSAGNSVVVRGANAGFNRWLRRGALAQYSRLVFSVLDGLRAGGYCVGACRPRHF